MTGLGPTKTCNCSILGGTTDSRPCPIHDAVGNHFKRPPLPQPLRRSCGNCGDYRDCNLAQNDGRGVNCCGLGFSGWKPEPKPWVTPPVKS